MSPTQLERLTETLDSIHRIVTDPGRMRARVLFVGDCLHLDVISFLVAPLLTLDPGAYFRHFEKSYRAEEVPTRPGWSRFRPDLLQPVQLCLSPGILRAALPAHRLG